MKLCRRCGDWMEDIKRTIRVCSRCYLETHKGLPKGIKYKTQWKEIEGLLAWTGK